MEAEEGLGRQWGDFLKLKVLSQFQLLVLAGANHPLERGRSDEGIHAGLLNYGNRKTDFSGQNELEAGSQGTLVNASLGFYFLFLIKIKRSK